MQYEVYGCQVGELGTVFTRYYILTGAGTRILTVVYFKDAVRSQAINHAS